jgi:cellulose biosynthesis protein BcsQ
MASDSVLIPTHLEPYAVRAVDFVLARVVAFSDAVDNPPKILGVTVSRYDPKTTILNTEMEEKLKETTSKYSKYSSISLFPHNAWITQRNVMAVAARDAQPIYSKDFYDSLTSANGRTAVDVMRESFNNLASEVIAQSSQQS